MDVVPPTLAEQLAVPLVLLVCTSVIATVGWLLSRQLASLDKRDEEHDDRLRSLEMDVLRIKVHLKLVRPSDLFKTVSPPSEGGTTA
jgi:hypothetical protein